MSKRVNRRTHQRKKLPMAHKSIDNAQNKKLESLEKQVHQLKTQPEMKYTDAALSTPLQLSTGGDAIGLMTCAQGTQPFSRIGNQIQAKYVRIQGYIVAPNTATYDRVIRLQLVWDRAPTQSTGGTIIYGDPTTGAQCINDNSLYFGFVPNIFTPPAIENSNRYTILYDKLINHRLENTDTNSVSIFKISKRLNRKVKYVLNTAVPEALASNQLWFCVSIDNQETEAEYLINLTARVYFKDE